METLPPEAREWWAELVQAAPLSHAELRAAVQAHVARARVEAAASGFVDLELAEGLGTALLSLLDRTVATDDPEAQRLAQAAVAYFALVDDGEDDFASLTGFDDDVAVFNAVAEALGHGDLRVVI